MFTVNYQYCIGGDISDSSKSMLVNGILSATRGLGNHGDKKLKQCIAVEPHTMAVEVDQYAQFIVIATKGIWEVFSEKEVSTLLLEVCFCCLDNSNCLKSLDVW